MATKNLTENDKTYISFEKEYNSFKNAFYDKKYTFDIYDPKNFNKISIWANNGDIIEYDEPKPKKEVNKPMEAEQKEEKQTEPVGMDKSGRMLYITNTGNIQDYNGLPWNP